MLSYTFSGTTALDTAVRLRSRDGPISYENGALGIGRRRRSVAHQSVFESLSWCRSGGGAVPETNRKHFQCP